MIDGMSALNRVTVSPYVELTYTFHPNYIWRVGGEPAAAMQYLSDGSSGNRLAAIDRLRADAQAASADVCRTLEALIPSVEDRLMRRDILAVKRDLHGARPPKTALGPALIGKMAEADAAALATLLATLKELANLEAEFSATVDAEIQGAETRLAASFSRLNVRDGLRAVNPGLFHKLDKHFSVPRTAKATKAERQLDNAFLQYLSRSALKTSPLSSFTPVMVGQWTDSGSSRTTIDLPTLPLRRQITLRRSLLLEILNPLLKRLAPLSRKDALRLNRSLRIVDEQVVIHRVVEESSLKAMTWGVGLEELRLRSNSAITTIAGIFSRAGDRGLTLDALAELIGQQAQPNQVEALVNAASNLARLGVLQAVDSFHDLEDPLVTALARLPTTPETDDATALIRALDDERTRFEREGDAAQRSAISETIGGTVRALAALADVSLSEDIVKPFLYEDCLIDVDAVLSRAAVAPFTADLQRLVALSPLFDMNAGLQSWLAESFIADFGVDGVCNDPRGFLIGQMTKIDGVIAPWTMGKATSATAHGRELVVLRDMFYDHLVSQIDDGGHSWIDTHFIDDLIGRIPEAVARRPKSHCFFGQIATAHDGTDTFVLNQILSGNSQLFARFLDGESQSAIDVLDYLQRGSRSGRVVELSGVFGFNANLHMPVASETLVVAPYPGNLRTERRLELDVMTLRYDVELDRVFLADATGEALDVHYFGLLNPGLMPQVQRILCGLSTQAPIFFSEVSSAMRRAGMIAAAGSFGTPRVSLGAVTLQRRARNVSHDALPDLTKLDTAQALIRIHEWRRQEQVPPRGFLRFAPSLRQLSVAGTDEADVDWAKFDRTKLKPFYVDFADPLLIRQFIKGLNGTRFDLIVQEPLPDIADQRFTVAGAGHVAELQVEITAVERT